MAVKMTLASLDGVPADVAKEYKKVEQEGKTVFLLDLDGYEDPAALKRAKDHEKEARKTAEKQAKDLATEKEKLQEEIDEMRRGNLPKADVDKLEASWKTKLAAKEAELTGKLTSAQKSLQKHLVDNVATTLAAKISSAPAVILPHIRSRLAAEEVNGDFVTRVLDKDGKPSAMSIEELQKEFTENKDFAAILVGSRASGSGGSGSGAGSGGSGGSSGTKNLATASAKDLAAHIAAKKQSTGG